MNDRELLEMAAKAAGINGTWMRLRDSVYAVYDEVNACYWNPLTDDADAFQLSVTAGIKFRWHAVLNQALTWPSSVTEKLEIQENGEDHSGDKFSASRRAIVRAAAEIGRAMP